VKPTSKSAELDSDSRPDPYRDTPLGVEAAWCPDGVDLAPPAGEAARGRSGRDA